MSKVARRVETNSLFAFVTCTLTELLLSLLISTIAIRYLFMSQSLQLCLTDSTQSSTQFRRLPLRDRTPLKNTITKLLL